MLHKVINCSSLHHINLEHLSLMLFSFMVHHKRSPIPTTIYATFTRDVPRAFEDFFCSWKANATARTGVSFATGKAWIFRDFGTSYRRRLCQGLAVREPGHRQQRQLQPEAARSLLPVSCPPVRALLQLEGGKMSQACECRVHAILLMSPLHLSSAIVAAWCRGCSQEVNWILFLFLWINLIVSLPE